jgi:potassium-dependent mechanosensitive channel
MIRARQDALTMALSQHQPTRGHRAARVLLVALFACLLALPGWSKDKPAPAAAVAAALRAASAPGEPQPYPVTEVFPRSEQAMSRMRQIRQEIDADRSAALVQAELPALAQMLRAWEETEGPTLREGRSVQQVIDLGWELGLRSIQIDRWGLLLLGSGAPWIAEAQTLDRSMAAWQATRAALPVDAPPVVKQRIDEVLREIEAVRQLHGRKTNELIAVQSALATQREALDGIRAELEEVHASSARGLIAQDSRPLWTAVRTAGGLRLPAQAAAGWKKLHTHALQLARFVGAHVAVPASVFAGLLALFVVLARLSRMAGHIQPNAAEQVVLDRGLLSALLLTLGLVPLLYPDLGPGITRLVILPGLVAVLALRRAIFGPRTGTGLYFFAVIYLLDFLRNYLPPQWLLARLLLLAVAVLGATGTAVLLARRRRRPELSLGVPAPLLALALLAFLASALANVAGNLSLAEYTASPLLRLAFVAVAIRLAVVAATTVAVMALRTRFALRSRVIQEHGEAAAAKVRRSIGLAGIVLWAFLALFNLGLLGAVQASFAATMKTEWQLGEAVISVRGLVIFLLVMFASYVLSRVLRLILAQEVFPRIRFPRGVPDALVLIARYGVLLLGFLLALSSAGVDLSKVTLALSALGVGIGFGLQNIVNNFVCGLILVFEHPIQVGDFIEVGPHYGRVTQIGFRSSTVRAQNGSDVVIPNADLIGTKVINWSLSDAVRLHIPVPVCHDADTRRVAELLTSVASANPRVCEHPAPKAVLTEFGENALKFTLQCWMRTEQMPAVRDELTLAIDQALREAGMRIPFAQTDVHLHYPEQHAGSVPVAVARSA